MVDTILGECGRIMDQICGDLYSSRDVVDLRMDIVTPNHRIAFNSRSRTVLICGQAYHVEQLSASTQILDPLWPTQVRSLFPALEFSDLVLYIVQLSVIGTESRSHFLTNTPSFQSAQTI